MSETSFSDFFPKLLDKLGLKVAMMTMLKNVGVSPSGKAAVFGIAIPRFES